MVLDSWSDKARLWKTSTCFVTDIFDYFLPFNRANDRYTTSALVRMTKKYQILIFNSRNWRIVLHFCSIKHQNSFRFIYSQYKTHTMSVTMATPSHMTYFMCVCPLQVEDNVTVVLLSEIVWDKFRPNTGCFEPLLLHFPDYSKGILTHTHTHTHTHTLTLHQPVSGINSHQAARRRHALGGCGVRFVPATLFLHLKQRLWRDYKTPLYEFSSLEAVN